MMRIMLVDDDALVLQALTTIITHHEHEVVATLQDGKLAASTYLQHRPDLVLMDIRMHDKHGIDAAQDILERDPAATILLLTTFNDEAYITKALSIGCKGYILKEHIDRIIPSIEAVAAGSMVFDQEIITRLSIKTTGSLDKVLTEREIALLTLVAEGLNNKEIAQRLFLSDGTVRNYISTMLTKLQVRDRTQLAIYYYKHT